MAGRAALSLLPGRVVDEFGRPPWVWPAPSLALLVRPPPERLVLLRYQPGVMPDVTPLRVSQWARQST